MTLSITKSQKNELLAKPISPTKDIAIQVMIITSHLTMKTLITIRMILTRLAEVVKRRRRESAKSMMTQTLRSENLNSSKVEDQEKTVNQVRLYEF